ncbi:Transposase and inactivated derivatives [Serratia quinivorans]|nr:Transposase and inactivated derivatives [Serratia quinivorans]
MFFDYPADIRKAIYTTNAIGSLNSVILVAIKKRRVFLTDDSVRKVIYLASKDASKNGVCQLNGGVHLITTRHAGPHRAVSEVEVMRAVYEKPPAMPEDIYF